MLVKFKRLSENAVCPTLSNIRNPDWDIYSPATFEIAPFSTFYISLELTLTIPFGYCGRFQSDNVNFDCSGFVHEGINEYVHVLVCNKTPHPRKIDRGEKIAKLVFEKGVFAAMEEIIEDSLETTNQLSQKRAPKRKMTRDVFTDDDSCSSGNEDLFKNDKPNLTYFI
jgi:dUTPase